MSQPPPDSPSNAATEISNTPGVLAGHEVEEAPYFAYSASLRIFGDHLDFTAITQHLGRAPTQSHRKGERRSPRAAVYTQDLWGYQPSVTADQPLAVHIDTLWAHIKHATGYLHTLKQMATVDVFLGYRSNIDHAGVMVPATSLTLFVALDVPFGLSIIIT